MTDTTSPFTQDQLDILRLVVQGLGDELIARDLRIPLGTVKGRLRRMRMYPGCDSRAGLAYTAGINGWLEAKPTESTSVTDQVVTLARMIVRDEPLGALRVHAQRLVRAIDGPSGRQR